MKKTAFSNRVTSFTVILTLALCIGCGIFGIFKAVDLLSVSAGEMPEVSPADASAEEVSLSDVSGDSEDGTVTVRREIRGMLYTYAFPPDQAVPFTYTHTVTTDSGKVKTTHRPSSLGGAEDGAVYNLYNDG